jgi:hypothetical protein
MLVIIGAASLSTAIANAASARLGAAAGAAVCNGTLSASVEQVAGSRTRLGTPLAASPQLARTLVTPMALVRAGALRPSSVAVSRPGFEPGLEPGLEAALG